MISMLSIGWALVVGASLNSFASRRAARGRARTRTSSRPTPSAAGRSAVRLPGVVGRVVTDVALRHRRRKIDARLVAQLPIVVDLLAVAIGAGHAPLFALDLAAQHCPEPIASALGRSVRAQSLGEPVLDAVARLGREHKTLVRLADVLGDAVSGGPVLDALGRLAAEERAALRRRAEARARTVPVRLLFPLVFLVLPAFGLMTVVPTIEAGLRGL